jgi:hypothetical protein
MNKYRILQVGCWGCGSIYNVIGDEYQFVIQQTKNPIFWKDLRVEWVRRLR